MVHIYSHYSKLSKAADVEPENETRKISDHLSKIVLHKLLQVTDVR